MAELRLSVLDTAPIVSGSTARDALHNTRDLARLTDELGYCRYWVAEHHGMRGVASAAPAVLVGELAAATTRIRVGAGGVLLPNHAPIVVAEQFGTLAAFHAGRIDLGIGRASGGSPRATERVRGGVVRADFAAQIRELRGYLGSGTDNGVPAVPAVGNVPALWLLGSTESSAALAGSMGLPYAFAYHLNPTAVSTALARYRDSFRPSDIAPAPAVLVSVTVIAAATDEHAAWLAGPAQRKYLARQHGARMLLPTPEEAAAYPYTAEDHAVIDARFACVVTGSARTVRRKLHNLADRTGADELLITTQVHDHADRRRSYELVAG